MAPPSNTSYMNLVRRELMRAVNMRNLSEVELAIAAGANVNWRGNNGYNALMRTVRGATNRPRERRDIIRALIMDGANPSARGPNGRTVRNYAINGNRTNHGNRREAINAALEYAYTRSRRWYNHLDRRPAWNSNSNRPVLSVQAKENLRAKVNTPVNRPWNNFKNKDPISLNNRSNWKGNRAIEVNTNGRKTYFYPANFNTYFTNEWKNMSPTSKSSIHPTKRHPLNRSVVRRNQVKLVKFIGNKDLAPVNLNGRSL